MAFTIQIADAVEAYVRDFEGLSEVARQGIVANLLARLGEDGDHYRSDPSLRVDRESFYFWFHLRLLDAATGQVHRFRFLVSDEHAVFGILAVVYADTDGPALPSL